MDVLVILLGIALFLFLGSVPFIVFIIGIVKKTMRWSSFIFNLVVFLHSFLMVWTIGFVFSEYDLTKGLAFDAWLPAIIGALAFAAAIKSLSYKKTKPSSIPDKVSPLGWALLVGGELAYLIGFFASLHYLLAPDGAQFSAEEVRNDVLVMNLAWFVGCALCYWASRYDIAKIPDLAKWIAMGSGFFLVANTPPLVGMHLMPYQGSTYPHEASLLMLSYIPLIVLFTLLARDFHKPVETTPA